MKKGPLLLLSLFATLAISASATTIPINLDVDSSGHLIDYNSGVATKALYGSNNNNPTSNLDFLNAEIAKWNATNGTNPDLEFATATADKSVENLSGNSYTTVAGYDYVVFHFGAGNAGSAGGYWEAFYIGGQGGITFTLPTVNGKTVGGFSSARYFKGLPAVPDLAGTLLLVGMGLTGVRFMSRRARKA